jgi:hypothetical protein
MPTWTPKNGSNSWADPQNWDSQQAPLLTQDVIVGNAPDPLIAGGGFARNLTIANGRTVTIGGSMANMQSSLSISGTIITNRGEISLNPVPTGYSTTLEFDLAGNFTQSQLTGGGTILMSDSMHNFIESGPNGVALVNVNNTITGAGQFGNGSAIRLDNQAGGTISASQKAYQLIINLSQAATNEGHIQTNAGSAGLSIYRTTINSTGGGFISANGTNANVSLTGATLIGGTLQTGGGGFIQTMDNANVIDSVTNTGSIHVNDDTSLTLKGNITNAIGAILMQADDDQTYLNVDATGANLVGPGLVTLTDSEHNVIRGSGNNSVLNNLANLISGAGMIGGNGLVVNNAGVITATGVNNALIIETGGVLTNSGVLSATGPAGLEINGTTVNGAAGGEIIANAPNAHVELTAAHLTGGTLITTGAGAEIEAMGEASILDGTLTNVTNTGTVSVGAGVILQLWGTIKNTGNFEVDGTTAGGTATLTAGLVGATLTGGGTVTLGASSSNSISGEGSSDFTNQNNTISGAGSIVDMTLTNGGTIDATSASAALQIHTTNTVTNNGFLEANAGTLDVLDAVTGSGSALIVGGGTTDFSAAFGENVAFEGAGHLILSQAYGGTISGFGVSDSIDLANILFASGDHVMWQQTGGTGTLSLLENGVSTPLETMTLAGQYTNGEFTVESDGHGGSLIELRQTPNDFNGDSSSDLLWRNAATGQLGLWNSNGTGGFTYQLINQGDPTWQLQDTGDFNGDGKADLLWRNTGSGQLGLWNSNGSGGFTYQVINQGDLNWQIQGVGDFNGDGKSDLLWSNTATGQLGLWYSNGAGGFTYQTVNQGDLTWQIQGTGDFNGDGKSDLLWRNTVSGQVGIWDSNGSGGFTYQTINQGDLSWNIFNGNDTLVASAANSTLFGNPGNTTFAIGPGAGQDKIYNFATSQDTLQFNHALFANFAAAMTNATQVGANTVFAIDANDSVTLENVNRSSLAASNFRFA